MQVALGQAFLVTKGWTALKEDSLAEHFPIEMIPGGFIDKPGKPIGSFMSGVVLNLQDVLDVLIPAKGLGLLRTLSSQFEGLCGPFLA